MNVDINASASVTAIRLSLSDQPAKALESSSLVAIIVACQRAEACSGKIGAQ
jgi:hypothetical protein